MKTRVAASHPPAPRPELLHSLVTEHRKALTAYAARLLGDHHIAEDIAQEALIRAWPHTDRLYSTEGSIRGWLLRVTHNLVVDRLRSPAVRYETIDAGAHDLTQRDHTDAVLASVESARLLRLLSREHREVLVHTYLCGRTVQETAGLLGVPAGTVKSRQHYALLKLRSDVRATAA
ncbi:sigma-70 family RNA polymerase sigma factor [Streptomyces sp. NBC_01476]|uniref:sigma-70 family RNA polymerase sigma factor n=1 Tax=Streptomyces sp. NBC_01476 TaxID=2903881 RepID=UPI002E3100CE|nr:sigma-70 family RNA polymerase sigma factor [Streptomyces sp. NBC_01476]